MTIRDPILEQAALWHARETGAFGPDDERALEAWLAQSLKHRLAYADVAAAGYAASVAAPPAARAAVPARPPRRWTAWVAGAAAAPVLLAALMWGPHYAQDLRSDAHTATGITQSSTLADGSRLQLDTDSAVRLDFSGSRRDVELLRGALAVEVVKDPTRPFRVRCDGVTATAVGTRFLVDRHEGVVEVDVTEGRVAVDSGRGEPLLVGAGERVRVAASGATPVKEALADGADAWTRGILRFDRAPLGEAVARIGRYLPQRVILRAGDKAAVPVTATLPLSDPAAALAAVADTNGLVVRRYPGVIYVTAAH